MVVELVDPGLLHNLAQVHNGHSVAYVPNDAEIVRDEQVRQAEPVLKLFQQVYYLRLNRDVEGRDRLVAAMNSGSTDSARAITMRCCWPPLNSWG